MNLKEKAKHFRNRLKHNGVKASVTTINNVNSKSIIIQNTSYNKDFSEYENTTIVNIANAMELKYSSNELVQRGDYMKPSGASFYL